MNIKKIIFCLAAAGLAAPVEAVGFNAIKPYLKNEIVVSPWGIYGGKKQIAAFLPRALPFAAAGVKLATSFMSGDNGKTIFVSALKSLGGTGVVSLLLCAADVLEHNFTEVGNRYGKKSTPQPHVAKYALHKGLRIIAWTIYACVQNNISPMDIFDSIKHPLAFLRKKWSIGQMARGITNTLAPALVLGLCECAFSETDGDVIETELNLLNAPAAFKVPENPAGGQAMYFCSDCHGEHREPASGKVWDRACPIMRHP